MCGRYAFAVDAAHLPEYFRQNNVFVEYIDDTNFNSSYNIGPTNYAPVITGGKLLYMRWGLVPGWVKDLRNFNVYRTFNARKETLENPSLLWKPSISHRRCVVPIQGYYEWIHEKQGSKINKIPFYIRKKQDSEPLFLAGLWSKTSLKGKDLYSYSIVTGPSPALLKWLHERTPVILNPGSKEWDTWLDSKNTKIEQLESSLAAYSGSDLQWYTVSQEVNSTHHHGKQLIAKVEYQEPKKVQGIMEMLKGDHEDAKRENLLHIKNADPGQVKSESNHVPSIEKSAHGGEDHCSIKNEAETCLKSKDNVSGPLSTEAAQLSKHEPSSHTAKLQSPGSSRVSKPTKKSPKKSPMKTSKRNLTIDQFFVKNKK